MSNHLRSPVPPSRLQCVPSSSSLLLEPNSSHSCQLPGLFQKLPCWWIALTSPQPRRLSLSGPQGVPSSQGTCSFPEQTSFPHIPGLCLTPMAALSLALAASPPLETLPPLPRSRVPEDSEKLPPTSPQYVHEELPLTFSRGRLPHGPGGVAPANPGGELNRDSQ